MYKSRLGQPGLSQPSKFIIQMLSIPPWSPPSTSAYVNVNNGDINETHNSTDNDLQ